MKTLPIKSMLFVLAMAAASLAQTIAVVDSSNPTSPVSLKGTATFTKEDVTCSFAGHNKSSLLITAWTVKALITRPDGVPGEFWHTHKLTAATGVAPGKDFTFGGCEFGVSDRDKEMKPTTPSAVAQVVAVRYDDGTSWGDVSVIDNAPDRPQK